MSSKRKTGLTFNGLNILSHVYYKRDQLMLRYNKRYLNLVIMK